MAMLVKVDGHELYLECGGGPGPTVVFEDSLGGNRSGGLIAWMAAMEHPDDVAGVALIDASHPDQTERWESIMNDEQRKVLRALDGEFPYTDFQESLEEAAAQYGSLPEIPLTVITATRGFVGERCIEGLPCEAMQAIWLELQNQYAQLRPDARHIKISTGHYVHEEHPDLVVDEIRNLLAKVKT